MNASNHPKLALPKPRRTRKARKTMHARPRIKAMSAKRRKEAVVIARVRSLCVARDGYCRLGPGPVWGRCDGPSTLAHVLGRRRSQTRGMAPEKRHDPAWCVMLCARHHSMEEEHDLAVVAVTADGANGELEFPCQPRKPWRAA